MTIEDTEHVDLATPSGPMRTHLFGPTAPGKYPGILLYSEIFQVTGPIRRKLGEGGRAARDRRQRPGGDQALSRIGSRRPKIGRVGDPPYFKVTFPPSPPAWPLSA